MFVYLSKKIAIPKDVRLRCISWNAERGWIACGGEDGLLKVLKLEGSTDANKKAAAQGGNLSQNQTLEGHKGAVLVVNWNHSFQKLTTSDENGLIIVWMLHKDQWYEEMVNNRNKSVVKDMKWTSNGEKICIIYEDGAVIVGSVDGNRLWGRELGLQLALVEWSPDGRLILFATTNGECHIYDSGGNPVAKMSLYCNEGYAGSSNIIGLEWYDGVEGYQEPDCPVLAICLDNGRMQLMSHETDDNAVCIDTGMKPCKLKWNYNGSVLAVAGSQNSTVNNEARQLWMVQFYNHNGEHLRTLRIPGSGIQGLCWEGNGLRLALAVDHFVYFANVRPDYKWGFFCNTLVYAFSKPDRPEQCVMFWDITSNDRYAKYVRKLTGIKACGDFCVLATQGENPDEYILILCNAIGSPVDSKYVEVEPKFITMTDQHVVVASDELVYVWHYRTAYNKPGDAPAARSRIISRDVVFHINDPSPQQGKPLDSWKSDQPADDPVTALCASDSMLLVGRASGLVQRYGLPHLGLEGRHLLRCRPNMLSLNCDSTRLAVIDIQGVLSFFDLTAPGTGTHQGEHLTFERKDAWDMKWSDDNPDLFAMMEKTRMYVFRGLDPEEPVTSSGHLCKFHDLEIRSVLLDDIMQQPDQPDLEHITLHETRSLRDSRQLLQTAKAEDAFQFIDANSHPRLWRILAEHSLENLDWNMAEKAFVQCADYQGIQLIKHLRSLDTQQKQRAEVAVYFKRFDEAEALYLKMDRPNLAIEMRMRLGDWFKVERLIKDHGGDDAQLMNAWNKIGEYYSDRHRWNKAAQYYAQAKNSEMLVDCFYALEDYSSLRQLMDTFPEGSPSLLRIGEKFQSVGLCTEGVQAFVKAGDVKRAVDCCVLLNQWDQAVVLAQQHNFPQIEQLLNKYAGHLLEKNKLLETVELYRKANRHSEAAKLLVDLAKQAAAAKVHPVRVKKLYVLAALEVERFRKLMLDTSNGDTMTAAATMLNAGAAPTMGATMGAAPTAAAQTLAGLMTLDEASASGSVQESAWRGAEAYHFWLLAHRQLYEGNVEAAMRTALHLRNYEDILEPVDVYSFLGLAAFYTQFFGQCSKAFIKLEVHPSIPQDKRQLYADLAMSVFLKNPPVDPRPIREARDKKSNKNVDPMLEDLIGGRDQVCVATGRIIKDGQWFCCKVCKHPMYQTEIRHRGSCPLCHSSLAAQGPSRTTSSLYMQ